MSKRLIALILLVALCLPILTACGGGTERQRVSEACVIYENEAACRYAAKLKIVQSLEDSLTIAKTEANAAQKDYEATLVTPQAPETTSPKKGGSN